MDELNLNDIETDALVAELSTRDNVNIYTIEAGHNLVETLGEYHGAATVVIINA